MKKNKKLLIGLIVMFVVLLGTTLFVSFSSNTEVQEVIVKSITPVYDENSTIVVDNNNVVFNDKNQVVDYKVVIENTQNYDVKITDIKLTTPTEEFLQYTVEDISKDDVLAANSTKELTISLETTGIKGWGRNFADELTANISFEKAVKEVTPPAEETPKEEAQPEAPATNIEEVINKSEKIEVEKITNNTIEFKDGIKLEDGDKAETWIYPETEFYGYKEADESNVIKEIVLEKDKLDELEVKSGEHNVVISTEEKEVLGYVEIYINENKELLIEKTQDTTDKEENKPSVNKPSEDKKEDEEGKIENPYTSDKGLLVVLIAATGVTGLAIIIVSKNKFAKYTIFIMALSTSLTVTTGVRAEKTIELPIKLNVEFKSQNVMDVAYTWTKECWGDCPVCCAEGPVFRHFWTNSSKIKNIYIENEITKIDEFVSSYDVTEAQNGRVKAYLVYNKADSNYYDVYWVADGIIYPNSDASYYFAHMNNLSKIDNLEGLDTSNVINMRYMFAYTGNNSTNFILDVSNFDTSKVTDMSSMFNQTGYSNQNFTLDVSNFDTSNVIDMNFMFYRAGYNATTFTLDVSNFDTSKVTNMSSMFSGVGYSNPNFTLDVSNFDTSNVTDMSYMFNETGMKSETLTLDLSNFDTSKVTDMSGMFSDTGNNNPNFTLDVSNFDTSNVTDMSYMFDGAGYNSENFTLDLSNFDTSNVTDMSWMFSYAGRNSENFTLDVSNFDTSNVTDMSWMFSYTGYSNPNFTLDVSNFDTRNVTELYGIFSRTGYNSTKLNITFAIQKFISNTLLYDSFFEGAATKGDSKITINYTSETSALVDQVIADKPGDENLVKGKCLDCGDGYLIIGTEITIGEEKFNVISQTDDTVSLLAQLNLGTDYRQGTNDPSITFADMPGWEYTPGPKEIDIQTWSSGPKTYVNKYVEYLQEELNDDSVTGDLIALEELKALGCSIHDEYTYYSYDKNGCTTSLYKDWLFTEQSWWTRSADSGDAVNVWYMDYDGIFKVYYCFNFSATIGVRPVITISKETLEKLN